MKTKGQIAYEAFSAAFLPKGIRPIIAWQEVRDTTRAAWEAAAEAVSVDKAESPDKCCDGVAYCREHNPSGRLS